MELEKMDNAEFLNYCSGYLLMCIGKGEYQTGLATVLQWSRQREMLRNAEKATIKPAKREKLILKGKAVR